MSKVISIQGNHDFSDGYNITSFVTITDTTNSSTSTTGALIVSGGVGIGENLNIGGNVNIESTSTSSSALVVAGNVSIGGKFIVNVRQESLNTTPITLENDYILNVDNTSTIIVNVPDASSNTGVQYIIIKVNATPGQVTVTSVVASQLFSGGSTYTTIALTGGVGERMVLLSNGLYWYVM